MQKHSAKSGSILTLLLISHVLCHTKHRGKRSWLDTKSCKIQEGCILDGWAILVTPASSAYPGAHFDHSSNARRSTPWGFPVSSGYSDGTLLSRDAYSS